MTNQLIQPKELVQRMTLITIAMLLIAVSITLGWYFNRICDPYVETVLSLQGNFARGKAIFQINCSPCHGLRGDGNVGPSLLAVSKRKSRVSLIAQVTGGKTPPMPKFQPNSQEMADLLSFLENL